MTRDPYATLAELSPADWSSTTLPTHPDWSLVVDDTGVPVWKTASLNTKYDQSASGVYLRLEDSRSYQDNYDLSPADIEYSLVLLWKGEALTNGEYATLSDISSSDDVFAYIDALADGRTEAQLGTPYEMPVGQTTDHPSALIPAVEAILDGRFLIEEVSEEDVGIEHLYNYGKYAVHLFD